MKTFQCGLGIAILLLGSTAKAADDLTFDSFERPPHARMTALKESLFSTQTLLIAGTTTAASLISYQFADAPLGDDSNAEALGSSSGWISDFGNYLPFALPIGFLAAGLTFEKGTTERTDTLQSAQELAEAVVLTYGTTLLIKPAIGRTRPNGQDNSSFPSGHTSTAFAAAGVLAQRYPWYVGVPAFAFASTVAFTRMDLGKHYLSDVAAGAGLGLFFATTVHSFHSNLASLAQKPSKTQVTPMVAQSMFGLSWSGAF